ncbi:MAG: glycosyltransferase family 2 protein [Edaphobacter sp.]|uniref:glycosyltransferase family 2 protein n=1 Tax=Edaphobacter sp. TaxID=1934404 RepID=UPI0023962078|nr:glycosyltransferase family 2 protein [Edaphobacter sp.]MDE1175186.1 glycosyltransferase family 2 protein [Edaphobacter sp.]
MIGITRTLWISAGTAAALLSLPGSLELLLLTVAALFPARRHRSTNDLPSPWKVAVIVPAHNEATGIAACVESLRGAAAADMLVDLYVIADNCTDQTAEIASKAGAKVLVRTNATERGKGYALHHAFTTLESLGYDCFLIVDADTEVAPGFITEAAGTMRGGAQAVQVRYLVSNLEASTRTRLMGLALRAFNVVRPLGRDQLGLSAGILGNGFGLTAETLRSVPYLASSVVEDLEYHLALVRSGRRVAFVNTTTVFGEMPVQGKGVKTQRSRWEGGRLRMLLEKSPELAMNVLHGQWRMLEPLLELLLLPLAFHVTLLAIAVSTPAILARSLGAAGILIVALHLLAAILVGGGTWHDAGTLFVAPFYVLWKLMMIPATLRNARSKHAWVRTSRNAELASESDTIPPAQ